MANTDYFKRMFSTDIERIWRQNKGDRSAVVYLFENLKTSKGYVGTTVDVKIRLAEHIRSVENGEDTHFYRSVRKHGWETFEFFILESELTQKEGYIMEKKWIKYLDSYRNGYNSTPGGEGFSAGEYHAQTRKIKAINFDTKEEFHFDWIGSAIEHLEMGKSNIHKILSDDNNNYLAYNIYKTERYIFKYEEDETPWNFAITPWEVPIVLRNIDTKELLFFRSITKAGEYINVSTANISSVLRNDTEQVYSRTTRDRYEAQYDPPARDWKEYIKEDAKNVTIIAYKDGELIKTYKSTEEAAIDLKILKTSITNCLRKRSKSAGGYIFVYEEQERVKTPRITPVFYMKDDQKVSFENIKHASISTLNGLCVDYRARQIRKSIKSQLPDPQGIQWFKS
jgi:group I intron endonuclease